MDPFKPYQPRPRIVPLKLTASDAETVALQAVAWIVACDQMRDRFIGLTGCGADDLRNRIGQAAFLGSVLDFILGDEATAVAFAEQTGLAPETPMLARTKLP